jgi:hypothetical protein
MDNYQQVQQQLRNSGNVTGAMQHARGFGGKVSAGLEAALKSKFSSLYTDKTSKTASAMRAFGMSGLAKWHERFFVSPKNHHGVTQQNTVSTRVDKLLIFNARKLNSMSVVLDNVASNVLDIKSLLMPKIVTAKGKGKDPKIAQYDPLAPEGHKYKEITKNGKLTTRNISKEHMSSASMQAALYTAKLVEQIRLKDEAKGEFKRKYSYKDYVENYKTRENRQKTDIRSNQSGGSIIQQPQQKTSIFDTVSKIWASINGLLVLVLT